jgi:peptidoglycan/LPS O-acetylase OafA/YrhL
MRSQLPGHTPAWLDAIRGISAEVVVIGHSLMVLLVAGKIDPKLRTVLQMGSSIASNAVVAFFVMSGYLVGGRVIVEVRAGDFAVAPYLQDRLVRLLLVLLPALLVTAALDWATFNVGNGDLLLKTAVFPQNFRDLRAWDWTTLLSNATFLQTITAPPFGTNFALWSISNEFWYYVSLPCLRGVIAWRWLATRRGCRVHCRGDLRHRSRGYASPRLLVPDVFCYLGIWSYRCSVAWQSQANSYCSIAGRRCGSFSRARTATVNDRNRNHGTGGARADFAQRVHSSRMDRLAGSIPREVQFFCMPSIFRRLSAL